MKAILISIQPQHVANILNGNKILEIRKTIPKCVLPIEVYIYCTKKEPYVRRYVHNDIWGTLEYIKSDGKVVAKFTLNKVEELERTAYGFYKTKTISWFDIWDKTCLSDKDLDIYFKAENRFGKVGYAWHIDNLEIFDKPKEISEFYKVGYEKCAKPQGSLREKVIENYNNALKYQLTRAPQSWCYIEV